MSPRRKSGLSAKHLRALEHLPDVLEALEALADQRERVASLTMRLGGGAVLYGKNDYAPATISARDLKEAMERAAQEADYQARGPRGSGVALPDAGQAHNPTLDTPERRAYEEAKRSGTTIPDVDPLKDPLRNASDAQRERMAEQRALIAAERQRKGMPPSRGLAPAPPVEEDVSVRTEELPTSVNGSAGAEEEREP